ncbi:predicted protein [Arabidopsis lyrata subsp. lyrata]|uniref:Predicted protein n=1 Tax=Arabidopsis lyrata subsp. lyrata TaxID=81972 RepID=D7LJ69_ARALL|nr:predicted protein [Arabidopsis lyrata subsp. lyrata]
METARAGPFFSGGEDALLFSQRRAPLEVFFGKEAREANPRSLDATRILQFIWLSNKSCKTSFYSLGICSSS